MMGEESVGSVGTGDLGVAEQRRQLLDLAPAAGKYQAAAPAGLSIHAPGNLGGPGNPYARQVAAMRKVMVNFFNEERMRELAFILYEKAARGDMAAARDAELQLNNVWVGDRSLLDLKRL